MQCLELEVVVGYEVHVCNSRTEWIEVCLEFGSKYEMWTSCQDLGGGSHRREPGVHPHPLPPHCRPCQGGHGAGPLLLRHHGDRLVHQLWVATWLCVRVHVCVCVCVCVCEWVGRNTYEFIKSNYNNGLVNGLIMNQLIMVLHVCVWISVYCWHGTYASNHTHLPLLCQPVYSWPCSLRISEYLITNPHPACSVSLSLALSLCLSLSLFFSFCFCL